MEVINFNQVAPGLCQPQLVAESGGVRRYRLCHNRYFVTERVEISQGAQFDGMCDGSSLEIWGVIEGAVQVNDLALEAVRFTLLPAAMGAFSVRANRDATLLRTYVGSPT